MRSWSGEKGVRLRCASVALLVVAGWAGSAHAADSFTAPTKEELELKSLPGYPGAPAVVLYREEIAREDLSVREYYTRIKILTEAGKKYANVELAQQTEKFGDMYYADLQITAAGIQARTIHADGTVIPYTGKPYVKTVVNNRQTKVQEKFFTLPDVEVGSILEYRYSVRNTDEYAIPARWYLQGDLFVRKAHYVWYPTTHEIFNGDGIASVIHVFPILRPQDKLEHRSMPISSASYNAGGTAEAYELTATEIPPAPQEEFMPPIRNFTYRVLFLYTPYVNAEEFWSKAGKEWAKQTNNFAGPNGALRSATQPVIAGATTDEEKLRRIYATVMGLENTAYTRDRAKDTADKAKVENASDVLAHKRGNPVELTMLFVGMARAAGMQANAMLVPDRSVQLPTKGYESLSQFDGAIAVVNVGGKERFFDPGARFVPFGRLAWEHTWVDGLRQMDNGAMWGQTPGDPAANNSTYRVANLKMDDGGAVTGTISMTYNGAQAVDWRQRAVRGDSESLIRELEDSVREVMPKTMTVRVAGIFNLDDYEKPLEVKFDATGTLGNATGKRMMVPADLFNAGATAAFPHETRGLPVYFPYPQTIRDAVRINLPPTLQPEAVPDGAKYAMPQTAGYGLTISSAPTQFTTRREFACNTVIVDLKDYPQLRTFYSQFEAKDQESVVLKQVSAQASIK